MNIEKNVNGLTVIIEENPEQQSAFDGTAYRWQVWKKDKLLKTGLCDSCECGEDLADKFIRNLENPALNPFDVFAQFEGWLECTAPQLDEPLTFGEVNGASVGTAELFEALKLLKVVNADLLEEAKELASVLQDQEYASHTDTEENNVLVSNLDNPHTFDGEEASE